jgi:hypothetical protein
MPCGNDYYSKKEPEDLQWRISYKKFKGLKMYSYYELENDRYIEIIELDRDFLSDLSDEDSDDDD